VKHLSSGGTLIWPAFVAQRRSMGRRCPLSQWVVYRVASTSWSRSAREAAISWYRHVQSFPTPESRTGQRMCRRGASRKQCSPRQFVDPQLCRNMVITETELRWDTYNINGQRMALSKTVSIVKWIVRSKRWSRFAGTGGCVGLSSDAIDGGVKSAGSASLEAPTIRM